MKFLNALITTFTLVVSTSIFATEVASGPEQVSPLMNGQAVPSAMVKDMQGKDIDLRDLVMQKPTIVFFYRGGWCPYCNMQMGQLQAIESDLKNMGYQLIGISPDTPGQLAKSMTENELGYQLVSDANLEAMKAFGLAFYLDDKTAKRYRNRMGDVFATDEQDDRIVLPVPAAYVLNTQGNVAFQYVNPNFKARVEPEVLKLAAKLALN